MHLTILFTSMTMNWILVCLVLLVFWTNSSLSMLRKEATSLPRLFFWENFLTSLRAATTSAHVISSSINLIFWAKVKIERDDMIMTWEENKTQLMKIYWVCFILYVSCASHWPLQLDWTKKIALKVEILRAKSGVIY